MVITTREQLKDHIHSIHNYIRNNGAGYGMEAMKIFNVFYGLKLIDPIIDKVGWDKNYSFENLMKLINKNKDEELVSVIREILIKLHKNEILLPILFHHIPLDLRASVYVGIIKMINKIPISSNYDVDLAGKSYEYFIGRDKTAISELGAYFTDRHITNFIMDQLNIHSDNNKVLTMIDPFGGSGGFTLTYVMKLMELSNIDWKTEKDKIYHYDMSESVVKSAALEMFALTEEFVDRENNFIRCNSFTNEFNNKKFHYVITNPPYGGDKSEKKPEQENRDLLIEELKKNYKDEKWAEEQIKELNKISKEEKKKQDSKKVQYNICSNRIKNFCDKYNIKDYANDKEAGSLILIMDLVEEKGTGCGVLKEGVFFDNKYSNIRKVLIDNFNVKKVISVPADQFENTTTKTSVLIFENNGKTENVIFSDLIIEKEKDNVFEVKDNKLHLIKKKDDVFNVKEQIICSASYEQLSAVTEIEKKGKNGGINEKYYYSLSSKKYNIKKLVCNDKYKLVKLGDMCEFLSKSKRKASFGNINGKYNFYTSSENIKKCDIADYDEKNNVIIIGDGGLGTIFYDNKFSCSDHNHLITTNNKIQNYYIYTILQFLKKSLFSQMNGSTLKNLSKTSLKDFQIPIPKTDKLLNKWTNKISEPYDNIQKKKKELEDLEEKVKMEVKRIGDEEKCDMMALGELCEINDKKIKKYETSYGKENGLYNFHTGSTNGKLYCDNANINIWTIIINKTNGSGKCNIFLDKNISCAKQTFILQSKILEIETIYIYYQLNKKELEKGYMGACHKNLSFDFLKQLKIPIPQNKQLIQDLDESFNKIENLQQEIKDNETEYNKVLKELEQDIDLKTEDNLIDIENDQLIDIESGDDLNEDIKLSNKKKPLNDIKISNKQKNKIVSKN